MSDSTSEPTDPAAEWVDDYPSDAQLFGATFTADDFDTVFGTAHPDGTTVAVRRLTQKPPPGWVRRNSHYPPLELTFRVLEQHASPRALDIIDNLTSEAWDDFISAWGKDGGLIKIQEDGEHSGKSRRSARRGGTSKTR